MSPKPQPLPQHHNIEQLSDEWFEMRSYRFTSSRFGDLMTNGRGKDTPGETFRTYVCETVENELFGEEESFSNDDTERGNELEPVAFNAFKERMALDFVDVTSCGFFTLGDYEGGSPDCLIGDDKVGEIKAPKRRKFFEIMQKGADALDKKWLWQIQHQMRVTGRKAGVFILIYLTPDNEVLLHTIDIERDEDMQSAMAERINIAIQYRNEYKKTLLKSLEKIK